MCAQAGGDLESLLYEIELQIPVVRLIWGCMHGCVTTVMLTKKDHDVLCRLQQSSHRLSPEGYAPMLDCVEQKDPEGKKEILREPAPLCEEKISVKHF